MGVALPWGCHALPPIITFFPHGNSVSVSGTVTDTEFRYRYRSRNLFSRNRNCNMYLYCIFPTLRSKDPLISITDFANFTFDHPWCHHNQRYSSKIQLHTTSYYIGLECFMKLRENFYWFMYLRVRTGCKKWVWFQKEFTFDCGPLLTLNLPLSCT